MRLWLPHPQQRTLATGLVLAAMLLRAYVPLGFMPASGAPLQLEICPMGLPMQMPAHHLHHHGGQPYVEDCPFGSAPAAGPISHLVVFDPAGQIASPSVPAFSPLRLGVRLERAHQARGPPTRA